jgi:hypothetical protein
MRRRKEGGPMIYPIDWFMPGVVGVFFSVLGGLKLYGFFRGIEGGADKPLARKLCGT